MPDLDGLAKNYIMPLCDTVTENNLSIISKGYDLEPSPNNISGGKIKWQILPKRMLLSL